MELLSLTLIKNTFKFSTTSKLDYAEGFADEVNRFGMDNKCDNWVNRAG